MKELIQTKEIVSQIFFIRGKKVLLDFNLSLLYEVETRVLIQQVKRNIDRFPDDFMFQLTELEYKNLKSQFVISSWGGRRTRPYAFSEQGVAMLSGVLRSKRAIQVNIGIMRAFVKMRELLDENKELKKKWFELESKYDKQFKLVFDALRQLIHQETKPKNPLGFKTEIKK
jgi:hypothetical protein